MRSSTMKSPSSPEKPVVASVPENVEPLAPQLPFEHTAISLSGMAPPDGVNLLANGSFEDGTSPGGPFKPNSQGFMSLQSGSTSLPGWTVVDNTRFGQDIAWLQNANSFVPNGATDGTHFLDLTGASDKAD